MALGSRLAKAVNTSSMSSSARNLPTTSSSADFTGFGLESGRMAYLARPASEDAHPADLMRCTAPGLVPRSPSALSHAHFALFPNIHLPISSGISKHSEPVNQYRRTRHGESNVNFGEKVKQLRAERNLTQPQLAQAIGIEQSYLSKLENDK